jgi:hypothetical protein
MGWTNTHLYEIRARRRMEHVTWSSITATLATSKGT